MPSTPAPMSLFTLHLQPTQRAWESVPRGTEILVTHGTVCLHQRLSLGGAWVHLPVLVRAGERYRVLEGGWMELEAVGSPDTHVQGLAQPRGWRAWLGNGQPHQARSVPRAASTSRCSAG